MFIPGLNFDPGVSFFILFKNTFSDNFSTLVKASNHQIEDKKN